MADDLKLVVDEWQGDPVDPYVRFAVALLEAEEHSEVLLGMDQDCLEVMVKLDEAPDPDLLTALKVPQPYIDEGMKNVTATLDLKGIPRNELRATIIELHKKVKRLKLAVRQQPRLAESLKDMGPGTPPWGSIAGESLDGRRTIVGIIDDGCAFANRKFLKSKGDGTFESRVLHLWDQTDVAKTSAAWKECDSFGYGREIEKAEIDKAVKDRVDQASDTINEPAIYDDLDYRAIERDSHGTHVMDIAAGNATAVSPPGVAPAADIIFVQIPKNAIGNPADSVLSSYLLDGLMYIFKRAGTRPVAVNISYGGYGGPHDGSTLIEKGMDELLEEKPGRAIVVSAGNALEAACHAAGRIEKGQAPSRFTWVVGEDDPTLNLLEIWYKGDAELAVALTPPRAASLGPVVLNEARSIRREDDDRIVGWIFHRRGDSGNDDNHILIALRPPAGSHEHEKVAPAPFGDWNVELANVGKVTTDFHAWIERDDAGGRSAGRKRQSRFAATDSSPRHTLGSLATGKLTISVGGYNTATQQVARYSACGPTRDGRPKPDVSAPAEEDPSGEGIMSASALNAFPSRMNGTSAAAPHVTGLVALMFQAASGSPLAAQEILAILRSEAENVPADRKLLPNSHWQEDLLQGCVGAGKVEAYAVLKAVGGDI